jgi:beta-mannosidase
MRLHAALLLALAAGAVVLVEADVSLRDHPIATATAPTYLDSDAWTASTLPPPIADGDAGSVEKAQQHLPAPKINITVPATVPGDLITDLQRARVIRDPWLDTTWIQNSSLWSEHTWTFSTTFEVSASVADRMAAKAPTLLLIFDGVKMGATVRVNGHIVGVVRDQFLRYMFALDAEDLGLVAGAGRTNRLDVTFGLDDVAEDGRFMACTGGWDWAPYSYTTSNSSAATSGSAVTFSKGIWKSVYLTEVPAETAAITHVAPHTHYRGEYPTARLVDGEHGGFTVNVTVYLWATPGGATGALSVAGSWPAVPTESNDHSDSTPTVTSSGPVTLPAGESTLSLKLTVSAAQIKLWWPNGLGAQNRYNVSAVWTPTMTTDEASSSASADVISTSRRMGFRVFALVTVNDTNATVVASNASRQVTGQVNDTGTFGMFFR